MYFRAQKQERANEGRRREEERYTKKDKTK